MPRHDTEGVRTAIVEFIREFTKEHGYPPNTPEIGAAVGRTRQAVGQHLKALEEEGRVTLGPGTRTVVVVELTNRSRA